MQQALHVTACMSGPVFGLGFAQLISTPKENLRLANLSTLDYVFKRARQTMLKQLKYQYCTCTRKYSAIFNYQSCFHPLALTTP